MNTFIINSDFPSSIVHDINIYIDYCEKHQPTLVAPMDFVQPQHIYAINQQIRMKSDQITSDTEQNGHPLLHLFYHLTLAGELFSIKRENEKAYLTPISEKLAYFRQLTSTEQYFYLVKTLWEFSDWANIPLFPVDGVYWELYNEFFQIISEYEAGVEINNEQLHSDFSDFYLLGFSIIALYLEFFGILKIKTKPSASRRWIRLQSIELTPFGKKILEVLAEHGELHLRNMYAENETGGLPAKEYETIMAALHEEGYPDDDLDLLAHKVWETKLKELFITPLELHFQHLFPVGELGVLEIREVGNYTWGVYTFRIRLKRDRTARRKIQLWAEHTLDDLHQMIQQAYFLDNKDFYTFYLDNTTTRSSAAYFGMRGASEPPFAKDYELGELDFQINKKMLYIASQDEAWEFEVVLLSVEDGEAFEEGRVI